jgi:subtilisin family serine protease
MHRFLLVVSSLLFLMGCNTFEREANQELDTAAVITGAAWGEQVEVSVTGTVTKITAQGQNVPLQEISFQQRSGGNSAVIFKLPNPPFPFTSLPTTTTYNDRGKVTVTITKSNGTVSPEYFPFGSVVGGQINVLIKRPEGCGNAFSGLARLTLVGSPLSTSLLCFATLNVGNQGTQQGTNDLKNQLQAKGISLENVTTGRNVLYSTDPPDHSTDPTCRQITTWLDPNAKSYALIKSNMIASVVNATKAHTTIEADKTAIKGDGVTVVVLGSYNGTSDGFKCDLDQDGDIDWTGHDIHNVSIIQTIAPGATVLPRQVCDAKGECPSSSLLRSFFSFINQMNSSPNTFIFNASLGGPLPDPTLETLFQQPPFNNLSKFLLVTSTGNNGVTVAHYPATNAPGGSILATNLPNVMSVAALGLKGSNYEPIVFNTRENHSILAPGVNICPTTVTFRCNSGVPGAYNDNLGLPGTSFAAPFVTGVAALYADRESGKSFNLPDLLTSNAQPIPGFPNGKKRVWYQ